MREETSVEDIALSPGPSQTDHQGEKRIAVEEIEAEYLLDCSGRHSVIGTRLGLKREYAGLQKFAVYAHYVGRKQPSGIDGTLTQNGPRAGPLVLDHSSFAAKKSALEW